MVLPGKQGKLAYCTLVAPHSRRAGLRTCASTTWPQVCEWAVVVVKGFRYGSFSVTG